MASTTFEAQAASIRAVMRKFGLSAEDRKQLQYAEGTLNALAALRKTCLTGLPEHPNSEAFSAHISTEIIRLLHLPTDE